MRTQREAGATPGGCLLPLIVQFPIWLALFQVLNAPGSIPAESELAQRDRRRGYHLSRDGSGDPGLRGGSPGIGTALPYLAMLAIMVASQYIQTWHATAGQVRPDNPQAAAGQAVSRIMPLFIGFVSYNFPAGLVLYWMTGNIFRLLQQLVIFRIDGRPQIHADRGPRPPRQRWLRRQQKAVPVPGAADKRRRRKRK